MAEDTLLGGQAVLEGVMMRSREAYAIAVRNPKGDIEIKKGAIQSAAAKYPALKLPLLRGIVAMVETLRLGLEALVYSANVAGDEGEKFDNREFAITFIIAGILAVGLFILLPFFLSGFIARSQGVVFNLVDGIIRMAVFIAYLFAISLIPDVRILFQYHGAEHKVVNAVEHGLAPTLDNAKKYTTSHARCGTAFLLIVMVTSIIVFSVIPSGTIAVRIAQRIVLIPLIIGVSYELLKFSAKHDSNPVIQLLVAPGLLIQRLTTREPNDLQIEVSIAALNALEKK